MNYRKLLSKSSVLFIRMLVGGIFLLVSLHSIAVEKVSLQLMWKHQFQFAGYYVAQEMGFYKDAGLDVNIKEYDSGIDVSEDVLSQKVEFGIGRSSLIYEKMNGKNISLLFAAYQQSPFVLLASNEIQKVGDLKGKRIMVTGDVIEMASLNAMMLTSGIKEGDYYTQKHSFDF